MCANNDIRQTWPAEPQADGYPGEEDVLLEEVAILSTDLKISRLWQEVRELRETIRSMPCYIAHPYETTYECNWESPCPACTARALLPD